MMSYDNITIKNVLFLVVISFISININLVNCRSRGAPREACLNLKPKHGFNPPQPLSTNPFRFNVTLYPYLDNQEFIHIEIYSNDPRTYFRGFILQARLATNPNVIVDGSFVPMDNGKETRTYICQIHDVMKGNNTWTHSHNHPKRKVSAFWFVENPDNQEIVFLGTIVKNVSTYWLGVHSGRVKLGSTLLNPNENGDEEIDGEGGEADLDSDKKSAKMKEETDNVEDNTETTTEGKENVDKEAGEKPEENVENNEENVPGKPGNGENNEENNATESPEKEENEENNLDELPEKDENGENDIVESPEIEENDGKTIVEIPEEENINGNEIEQNVGEEPTTTPITTGNEIEIEIEEPKPRRKDGLDEQSEPSNHVDDVVSSAFSINQLTYTSLLNLLIFISVNRLLI